jgi:hypothetical protein
MKIKTEIEGIQLTDAARAKGAAAGAHLEGMLVHAGQMAGELGLLIKEVLKVHPSTGADAATYKRLSAIIAELG